jgi:hypothetical protein
MLFSLRWKQRASMLQRTVPLHPAQVARSEEAGICRPPRGRAILLAVVGDLARLLRALGQYFAAGGPLS